MKNSEMRTDVMEYIDLNFKTMASYVRKGDERQAGYAFDCYVGVINTAQWLGLITADEHKYLYDAALDALYK